MRQITFRGKTFKGEWIEGDLYRTPGNTGDGVAIQYWDENDGWMTDDVRAETVGQFTGLYDSLARPIFEGDILTATGGGGDAEVRYYTEWAGFRLRVTDALGRSSAETFSKFVAARYLVTGNIHDKQQTWHD